MSDFTVDTLILGATFYGCGLACAIPGSVIVESSIVVGSDYTLGFDPGCSWDMPLSNPAAAEFRDELLKRRALTADGRLLTGALSPVFAEWCSKRAIAPYLGLELVNKKGNTLTFVDFGGKTVTFTAKRIIDARCRNSAVKTLTAAIHCEKPLTPGVYGNLTITASPLAKLFYAAIPVDKAMNMQSARQLLHQYWAARPAELQDAAIAWSAMRFSSNNWNNPAAALDAGLSGIIADDVLSDTEKTAHTSFDTVVVGLGTAGIIAAIAAARKGSKVLAIEKNYYPGGVWTGGFVHRSYIQQVGGLALELQNKSELRPGIFGQSENLKMELEEAALNAGVTIEYGSVPAAAYKNGDRLTRIVYRNDSGMLTEVSAQSFIDSSADAVLCTMAGCNLSCGRQEDYEFNSYTNSMCMLLEKTVFVNNFDAGRVAQYDWQDLSQAFFSSARVHLREDYTDGKSFCLQISDNPGVREGLRIIPRKRYTLTDYFAQRGECDDPIFTVISNLDTHAQDLFFESEAYQDWTIAASCWEIRISIPVPLQVLFPDNVQGLMAPARHLGVDHDLGCAVRMIACMTAMGEAAGNIAVWSQQNNHLPHEIPYAEVQKFLPPNPEAYANKKAVLNSSGNNAVWHSAADEEIKALLQSENPALGIWNIKQQNRPDLARQVLQDSVAGSSAEFAAAAALALCGDDSVIPILQQTIKNGDKTPLNADMRFSAQRQIAALYLLGRLRKSETATFLQELLQPQECDKFLGHTVCALIKIADAHTQCRRDAAEKLYALAADTSWQIMEQLKGPGAALRRADGLMRLHIARALDRWQIPHDLAKIADSMELENHEKWLWSQYKINR